jgi:hypothetical protein
MVFVFVSADIKSVSNAILISQNNVLNHFLCFSLASAGNFSYFPKASPIVPLIVCALSSLGLV